MESDGSEHTGFTFTNIFIEGAVASVGGYSKVTEADGTQTKANFCYIYHFRDDKIVKITSYIIGHGGELRRLSYLSLFMTQIDQVNAA